MGSHTYYVTSKPHALDKAVTFYNPFFRICIY